MKSTRASRRGAGRLVAASLITAAAAAAAAALGAGGTAYAAADRPSGPSRVVFVASLLANSVTEYRINADGDTSPIATIAGANTGLSESLAIALAG